MPEIQEELCEKADQLASEAFSLKKSDINKAIALMGKAIKLCPRDSFNRQLDLSNYIYMSGDSDKAFQVCGSMLGELKYQDIKNYNRYIGKITGTQENQLFKEGKYFDYLFYKAYGLWNWAIVDAINGKKETLDLVISKDYISKFFTGRNENKAFKELDCEENKETYINKLYDYLESHKLTLLKISDTIYRLASFEIKIDESLAEKDISLDLYISQYEMYEADPEERPTGRRHVDGVVLVHCPEFMDLYKKINDVDFSGFFNSELVPLIDLN